jgi:NAD(P)-dependent dehydrogenase (short-subunit alcohol dehydrogenase family)
VKNLSKESVRTVVITGGGSGIGRSVALLCAERGDRVAVLDIDEQAAQSVASEAIELGATNSNGLQCDVSSEAQVAKVFQCIAQTLGAPYDLFANAGIDIGGMVHEMPYEKWRKVIDTNLTGVFLSCKYALQHMLQSQAAGSIVCSSSPLGIVAPAAGGAGAYSSTKAGISALVRCISVDYARYGIRANAIVPGATETRLMWNGVTPEKIKSARQIIEKEIPLGRLADPMDQARVVVWLLSSDSAYVTGSNLVCDGGILAKGCISL